MLEMSVLHDENEKTLRPVGRGKLRDVAVCCSVLQCVAVCCSVLQCVAVCCMMRMRRL
jgi:hypothetical protein